MPSLPPDSSDSPPPSAMPSPEALEASRPAMRPLAWRANVGLFAATVASCFLTWFVYDGTADRARHAAQFTGSLLAILLAHEFGHYIAARVHKVDASLPYFLPLPLLSPFGTMGAVIRMRSVIPTRRALLDIGASGPLAGLALAIPIYAWGVAHSPIVPLDGSGSVELGDSLLLRLLDHLFAGPVPDGMDIMLSPVAFAGWGGMFVTMINLLPVGQLDGGHVAFALFGPRQNRLAQWVHRSMLAFFFVSVASFALRDVRAGLGLWRLGRHIDNSLFWLVWFEILAVLGTFATRADNDRVGSRTRLVSVLGLAAIAGTFRERSSPAIWAAWLLGLGILLAMEVRGGTLRRASTLLDHPPTGAQPLGPGRAAIAIATLLLFAALFMPSPFSM